MVGVKDIPNIHKEDSNRDTYMRLWEFLFDLEKIGPKCTEFVDSDICFGGFIATDGITVHVKIKSQRSKAKIRRQEKDNDTPNLPDVKSGTMDVLERVCLERDMTGKVIVVVDGGKSPLLTAGYYRTGATMDKDGNLVIEPFYLSEVQKKRFRSQKPWQISQTEKRSQRPWNQQHETRKVERKTKRKAKKKRSRDRKLKKRGDVKQRSGPRPKNRASYGHFYQVSSKYWREITGIRKRQRKLAGWQEGDTAMKEIHQLSTTVSRFTPSFERFFQFAEFTLRHLDTRLDFYGTKRWRRMNLDGHISKKRAEGELSRSFFPTNIPKENIVVIWGDGDYRHNMPGTCTSPKDSLQKVIRRNYPALFLPGCEYRSSQKCPECFKNATQLKTNSKPLYKVLTCNNKEGHSTGESKYYERLVYFFNIVVPIVVCRRTDTLPKIDNIITFTGTLWR